MKQLYDKLRVGKRDHEIIRKYILVGVSFLALYILIFKGYDCYFNIYDYSVRTDLLLEKLPNMTEKEFIAINITDYLGEGSDIVIINSEGKTLFTTNETYYSGYSYSELCYIQKYKQAEKITVYEKEDEDGNIGFCVMYSYEEDGILHLDGYILLDHNYHVTYSTYELQKRNMSRVHLNYMLGINKDGRRIQSFSYHNTNNDARTILLIYNETQQKMLNNVTAKNRLKWRIFLLLYILIIFICIIRELRKSRLQRKLLHKSINEIHDGYFDLKKDSRISNELNQIIFEIKLAFMKAKQDSCEKERTMEMRNQVMAEVAHDVSGKLSVINGYTYAIRDKIESKEEKERYLTIILQKVQDMRALLISFQEYSTLDSPDLPLTFHTVDLCEFIQVYISKIYNEIDLAGFCVEAEMIEEKVLVRVDEHLFERVINNLIQNAIKYNPRGTTIKIIIENTENNVIFHIGDDGEGIPLVSGEDIFEPYAFKGNQGASPHGTGLGLAIAKKIITLHNGTIEYQSKPSEGFNTEYIIILPKTEISNEI